MATQDAEYDGTLWFFTQAGSEKVGEVLQFPHVNASYVSVEDHRYVSLSGRATVVQDAEKARELGPRPTGRGFPRGSTTPSSHSCGSTSSGPGTGTCSPPRWSSWPARSGPPVQPA